MNRVGNYNLETFIFMDLSITLLTLVKITLNLNKIKKEDAHRTKELLYIVFIE